MTLKHATTKIPGQKLLAVADWNAEHIVDGGSGEILYTSATGKITSSPIFTVNDTRNAEMISVEGGAASVRVYYDGLLGGLGMIGASNLGGYFQAKNALGATTAVIRSYASSGTQAYFTAGNVGIGTDSPNHKLDVNGDADVVGDLTAGTIQADNGADYNGLLSGITNITIVKGIITAVS